MEIAPVKIANTAVFGEVQPLEHYVPSVILALAQKDDQRAVPKIAKSRALAAEVEWAARQISTTHKLIPGDARYLEFLPSETVHLVVTSPPYWTLKSYPSREGQLGGVKDYDEFLHELDKVWAHIFRLLVPGGRLVIVVGDVCLSRRSFGRHVVFPLHAGIQERCRRLGFDNLAPIIWHKIANASLEVENGSSFLGKPYEPNAVIKNDMEFILFQRKPGGYRRPSLVARLLSIIPEEVHREWFQQIWTLGGASTKQHPAPFPLVLAERLVRMFSFAGDIVLDPFMGTGTTNIAAQRWGRHSIGIELEPLYFEMAKERLRRMQLSIEFDSN
jgi:modification methylase